MNKSTFRTLLAFYAMIFTAGFVYGFIREFRKARTAHTYTPSPEFQDLVNKYTNKEPVNA